ncbi:MAG TPA: hypothetical protein PLX23_07800 [Candidatus Hydrogenedens sp.]|nr:hypothetical protein [Candidatus Hydrogenedens sp.]
MRKKKNIKLNKDETLEFIEEELNNAIQFLDTVNQKVFETLKETQTENTTNNGVEPPPENQIDSTTN